MIDVDEYMFSSEEIVRNINNSDLIELIKNYFAGLSKRNSIIILTLLLNNKPSIILEDFLKSNPSFITLNRIKFTNGQLNEKDHLYLKYKLKKYIKEHQPLQ